MQRRSFMKLTGAAALVASGVASFSSRLLVPLRALARWPAGRTRKVLCLGLDGMDPDFAPGVGTPVPGGLSYREAHLAMEMLADTGKVVSAEFVEVNPVLDTRNGTADLGVELLTSLLGKKIL